MSDTLELQTFLIGRSCQNTERILRLRQRKEAATSERSLRAKVGPIADIILTAWNG
jgi:hypothetical protein